MPKTTKSESKLTPKQEKFVLNLIDGMSQRQAYIDAFNVKTKNMDSVDVMACRIFNDVKIRLRYHQLLEEQKDRFIASSTEKRKLLKSIIFDSREKLDNRLKAIDLDNKMAGEYVEKLDVNMTLDTTGELTFKYSKK